MLQLFLLLKGSDARSLVWMGLSEPGCRRCHFFPFLCLAPISAEDLTLKVLLLFFLQHNFAAILSSLVQNTQEPPGEEKVLLLEALWHADMCSILELP